jgi:hypothetical protein
MAIAKSTCSSKIQTSEKEQNKDGKAEIKFLRNLAAYTIKHQTRNFENRNELHVINLINQFQNNPVIFLVFSIALFLDFVYHPELQTTRKI